HAAISLGTMFGGWRIVKTMGSGITRLQPVGGFCAETSAAATIIGATFGGIPIPTTHAITGSILGVGTTKGVRAVRWIWGQRIVTGSTSTAMRSPRARSPLPPALASTFCNFAADGDVTMIW